MKTFGKHGRSTISTSTLPSARCTGSWGRTAREVDCHRAPCRLHHGVRLDDHDALSVLEDFLEAHVDAGPGIVHWEPTSIYVPHGEGGVPARIGLVFDSTPTTPTGAPHHHHSAPCSSHDR